MKKKKNGAKPPKVANLPEILFVLLYTPQSKTNAEPIIILLLFAVK